MIELSMPAGARLLNDDHAVEIGSASKSSILPCAIVSERVPAPAQTPVVAGAPAVPVASAPAVPVAPAAPAPAVPVVVAPAVPVVVEPAVPVVVAPAVPVVVAPAVPAPALPEVPAVPPEVPAVPLEPEPVEQPVIAEAARRAKLAKSDAGSSEFLMMRFRIFSPSFCARVDDIVVSCVCPGPNQSVSSVRALGGARHAHEGRGRLPRARDVVVVVAVDTRALAEIVPGGDDGDRGVLRRGDAIREHARALDDAVGAGRDGARVVAADRVPLDHEVIERDAMKRRAALRSSISTASVPERVPG